jgi:hypothetical protein
VCDDVDERPHDVRPGLELFCEEFGPNSAWKVGLKPARFLAGWPDEKPLAGVKGIDQRISQE